MLDKKILARKAREIYPTLDPHDMARAIRLAITREGVRHEPDVNRLMSEVGTLIAREDHDVRRANRRAA